MATAPAGQAPLMTAKQLLDLPDDGLRHELIEGVLHTMAPAGASGEALAWLDAGVRAVWVVDPENRTVAVYRSDGVAVLRGEDVLHGGDVLPGFTLPLPDLFL